MEDMLTSTLNRAGDNAAEIPDYPMARASGCPFDPPPELRAKQQEAPVVKVRLFDGRTAWVVTRYADQRAVLADPRLSADVSNPGYPSSAPVDGQGSKVSFILKDDPEHARLRRMVTAPFTIKRVEAMRPAVQKIVDELIDAMLAGPRPVDLVRAFALPVPSLVISELLGVPYDDHEFFQVNSSTMISRTASPDDDLLSGLVGRVEAGELPRSEAAQMGVLLLLAGHETTANMIALGTLALLQNPDQLALLRDGDDPKLVASAVEELLRYLNITHSGRRRVALADLEIAGRTIRAGEGVIFPNDIGNRDPKAFPEPDKLDIRRDARHHVAFGFGVHQCLGQPLARMELQVVYSTLYRRIPHLRLAAPLGEIPFKHDASVYGVHELPVTW
jgi:cytochrome P450